MLLIPSALSNTQIALWTTDCKQLLWHFVAPELHNDFTQCLVHFLHILQLFTGEGRANTRNWEHELECSAQDVMIEKRHQSTEWHSFFRARHTSMRDTCTLWQNGWWWPTELGQISFIIAHWSTDFRNRQHSEHVNVDLTGRERKQVLRHTCTRHAHGLL